MNTIWCMYSSLKKNIEILLNNLFWTAAAVTVWITNFIYNNKIQSYITMILEWSWLMKKTVKMNREQTWCRTIFSLYDFWKRNYCNQWILFHQLGTICPKSAFDSVNTEQKFSHWSKWK